MKKYNQNKQLLDFLEKEILTSMESKVIDFLIKNKNRYFTKKFLFKKMNAKSKKDKAIYNKIFNNLFSKNIIFITNKKKISINKNIIKGRIYFSKEGRVFFNESKRKGNLHLDKNFTMNSIHGDTVLLYVKDDIKKVVKVLNRKPIKIKGTYIEDSKGEKYIIADNDKIHKKIYLTSIGDAKPYDKVVVKLYKFNYNNKVYGIIEKTLGIEYEEESSFNSFLKEHKIRYKFPDKVIKEAQKVSKISKSDYIDRVDLRDDLIFTIDGFDAKDLDDAISIKKTVNGYRLGVHIADVSHYVKRDSELDKEAFLRGTSVYLLNKAIPMLPKELSNGICSLYPNVDRLTVSIIFDINNKGDVVNSNVFKSVIKSKHQLTYKFVQDVLDNKINNVDKDLKESILLSKELSDILRDKRIDRGCIDFDIRSPKIILDKNSNPVNIEVDKRLDSHNIIQEFMLLANEDIANRFNKNNVPFVYRVHPYPHKDKLEHFIKLMNIHGHDLEDLDIDNITPEDIAKIVNSLEGNKEQDALKRHLLKSMKQARYSDINDIHFGLASDGYCHFTSPIRRYPDLEIHRIIKHKIIENRDLNDIIYNDLTINTHEIAKSCSNKERKAERAEEELKKIKTIDYLNNNLNKVFKSSIVDIQSNILMIELENAVEGYAYLEDLEFDYSNYEGYSKKHNKKFTLGDTIKVQPLISSKTSDLQFKVL